MKYTCTVIAVANIKTARKFYEDLFGLELYQDYGINISFTCGISLQQEFNWLVNLPKDKVLNNSNNIELCFEEEHLDDVIEHDWGQRVIRFYDLDGHIIEVGENMKMIIKRFFDSGMSMEQISLKMDASIKDLTKLLNN